jgi:hypothetical protein
VNRIVIAIGICMQLARRGVRILQCKIVVPAPKAIRPLESPSDEGVIDTGSLQAILDFDPVVFRLREEGRRVILCDFEHVCVPPVGLHGGIGPDLQCL